MRYKLVLILLCAASFLALKSTVTLSQSEQITPTGAVELLVPAGQFPMGCSTDLYSVACDSDTHPVHSVYLDAFYIDKTEVTNAQYRECVTAGVCQLPASTAAIEMSGYYDNLQYDNFPIIQVKWSQANAYCQWVGKRLPTEAEWEKAARGTDLRRYPWGNTAPSCQIANFLSCKEDGPSEVGKYPNNASPYGALDMAGNVSEWVSDFYERSYYKDSPYYNPQGPAKETTGGEHLVRGGSWAEDAGGITTYVRLDESETYKYTRIGFRCARSTSDGPVPAPTATPTPLPGKNIIGPEGGLVWQTYQNHLTVAHVPAGALSNNVAYTITYNARPGNQGALQGVDHFFSLSMNQSTGTPIQLLLGHPSNPHIVDNTLEIYRLQGGNWVTDDITIVEESDEHMIATITKPGVYGLLGSTNHLFLPITLKLVK